MFDSLSRWFAVRGPDNAIDVFLNNVRRSGLLEGAEIDQLRREFEQSKQVSGDALTSFVEFMIARKALTSWQAAMLRDNKYKGFFLDDYVLLDHLGCTERSSRYLARERTSEKVVAIVVHPPGAKMSLDNIRYDVEEL